MKNDGQPIEDSVPWNSQFTKDLRWLNNVFLFSTEIWAEQLKNHPVCWRRREADTNCYCSSQPSSIRIGWVALYFLVHLFVLPWWHLLLLLFLLLLLLFSFFSSFSFFGRPHHPRLPRHPHQGSRFNLADFSRTICSCFFWLFNLSWTRLYVICVGFNWF